MRFQKLMKNLIIIFLIACVIFLAVDVFKTVKIGMDFAGMQSSERVSSSSKADEVRFEPTNYIIANKDEALEEIKKITIELKNNHDNLNQNVGLFEIGNIHKIETLFYEYQSYAIVKYKLLNIIEDLPKLYRDTKGYTNEQLKNYYNNNVIDIETVYGIRNSDEFVKFAQTLSFLGNGKIKKTVVDTITIDFDYENDILKFNMKLKADNGNIQEYSVRADYYKFTEQQVKPYIKFYVK